MNGVACRQGGCAGVIEDGYCNVCGLAEVKRAAAAASAVTGAAASARVTSSKVTTGTGLVAGEPLWGGVAADEFFDVAGEPEAAGCGVGDAAGSAVGRSRAGDSAGPGGAGAEAVLSAVRGSAAAGGGVLREMRDEVQLCAGA